MVDWHNASNRLRGHREDNEFRKLFPTFIGIGRLLAIDSQVFTANHSRMRLGWCLAAPLCSFINHNEILSRTERSLYDVFNSSVHMYKIYNKKCS